MKLPLFPLPVFILPRGITRLRIFEPRYIKMVKLATQGDGFAILLNSGNQQKQAVNWASWVEIIDFSQGDDGMLHIDVKCKALLSVSDIECDEDNLHFANVNVKEHWPPMTDNAQAANIIGDTGIKQLADSLSDAFKQYDSLNSLYHQTFFDDANWVIARWLELLPVELSVKNKFAHPQTFMQAKTLVEDIILKKK